ncbi:MAG: PIN domain-containing protein [Candidatus Kerfeldbacteria bacterium]|nr:PIN domain-containing protein [Candidatus Kerfeldbacteria bacterium]
MKEFSVFIDTNIFLRVYTRDQEKKAKECETVLRAIQQGKIIAVTAEIVLAEFIWTSLSYYDIQKESVIAMVKAIVALPNLHVQGVSDMLTAIEFYEQHSIKFIDAIIASCELVRVGTLPMLSYDADFDKIGIKRYEPADLLKRIG